MAAPRRAFAAPRSAAVRLLVTVAIVMGAAGFGEASFQALSITHLALLYSAAVMIVALWLGPRMSYFAAVLSYIAYDYLAVEPRYKLQFVTLDDAAVLLEFVGIAVLAGVFANAIRREAERNRLLAERTNILFQASRDLSDAEDEDEIRSIIARHVALATGADCVVAHGGRTWPSHPRLVAGEDLGRALRALAPGPQPEAVPGWSLARLEAKAEDFGVVAWRQAPSPRPPERVFGASAADAGGGRSEVQLISILLAAGVSAIARARLGLRRSEVEALVRTERLRDALLSSISHDLRTPLTSITAAVTSLLHFGDRFAAAVREDLLVTIKEEADRLNRFVANLLSMTRLDAGALTVHSEVFDVRAVLEEVSSKRSREGSFALCLEDAGAWILGDPVLLTQAIANITENAVRYGGGGPVRIEGRRDGEEVMVTVEDGGPGVAAEELTQIFQKFYRSASVPASAQGTGLGLSISKGLVESMGGRIRARQRDDGRSGLLVEIRFPRAQEPLDD